MKDHQRHPCMKDHLLAQAFVKQSAPALAEHGQHACIHFAGIFVDPLDHIFPANQGKGQLRIVNMILNNFLVAFENIHIIAVYHLLYVNDMQVGIERGAMSPSISEEA